VAGLGLFWDAMRFPVQLLVALAAFGTGVGLAELFGASSLGIAFGFGQLAFTLACVVLLLRA
jgi:hypothetical protein